MDLNLEKKVALVTGGGQGIGEAIVLALAREGADVIVNDLTGNSDNAKGVVEKARGLGVKAIFAGANVAKSDEVGAMVQNILKEYGRIDILVNNAGISVPALLTKMTNEQWDMVLDVNLRGVFNCTRAVVESMIASNWGRIITISSLGGKSGTVGLVNYCSAKAGCIGLTKTLAKELARYQILVNAVLPGYIKTPIQTAPKKYREMIIGECPLKRAGTAKEVAAVVAFLASPVASYITGATIEVGGGLWI